MVRNILVAGVGGQGVLTAAELIALAAVEAGHDVKKSEVHGLSQRGGSVYSHVRYGDRVYSPLIEEGDLDVLLALEQAEALRWVHYLRPGESLVILSTRRIIPVQVSLGHDRYPEGVEETVRPLARVLEVVDDVQVARELGNLRVGNSVLLGVLSRYLDLPQAAWETAFSHLFRDRVLELNLRAFTIGRTLARSES